MRGSTMAPHDTAPLIGQAALVTGASSGLGRVTAIALARSGADLRPSQRRLRRPLPPNEIAAPIVWIAGAPPELVLNEALVSPLDEAGWP